MWTLSPGWADGGRCRGPGHTARRMAMALATRMLKRSISREEAAPSAKQSGPLRAPEGELLPFLLGQHLAVAEPVQPLDPGVGKTTAAATTGPARGPRPTSSTPMRRCASARAPLRGTAKGMGRPSFSSLRFSLMRPLLAGDRTQVVELGPAHPPPADARRWTRRWGCAAGRSAPRRRRLRSSAP